MNATPCIRCGGSGYIPRFGHYAKGVCFLCAGSGVETMRAARKARPEPMMCDPGEDAADRWNEGQS